MGVQKVIEGLLMVTNTMAVMQQNQQWLAQLLKTINEEGRELTKEEEAEVRKLRDDALAKWNSLS